MNMVKAIILSLIAHLLFANVAHGNEPQLIIYNKFAETLVEKQEKPETDLTEYAINNEDVVELKSFKIKKIIVKTGFENKLINF